MEELQIYQYELRSCVEKYFGWVQVCLEAKGHHFETSTKYENLNCRGKKMKSECLADTGFLFSKSPVTAAMLKGMIRGTLF
jgi:hypothetical protein